MRLGCVRFLGSRTPVCEREGGLVTAPMRFQNRRLEGDLRRDKNRTRDRSSAGTGKPRRWFVARSHHAPRASNSTPSLARTASRASHRIRSAPLKPTKFSSALAHIPNLGLNPTTCTASVCPSSAATNLPLSISQKWTSPSWLPSIANRPSGVKLPTKGNLAWLVNPRRVRCRAKVNAFST